MKLRTRNKKREPISEKKLKFLKIDSEIYKIRNVGV